MNINHVRILRMMADASIVGAGGLAWWTVGIRDLAGPRESTAPVDSSFVALREWDADVGSLAECYHMHELLSIGSPLEDVATEASSRSFDAITLRFDLKLFEGYA